MSIDDLMDLNKLREARERIAELEKELDNKRFEFAVYVNGVDNMLEKKDVRIAELEKELAKGKERWQEVCQTRDKYANMLRDLTAQLAAAKEDMAKASMLIEDLSYKLGQYEGRGEETE